MPALDPIFPLPILPDVRKLTTEAGVAVPAQPRAGAAPALPLLLLQTALQLLPPPRLFFLRLAPRLASVGLIFFNRRGETTCRPDLSESQAECMSEVSLEAESGKTSAEDPQKDCEEADKAEDSLSEDVTSEIVDSSRGGEDTADVLYEINIDSDEENAESCDKGVQEKDEGTRRGNVVSNSVGSKAKCQVESTETPQRNGDSLSEIKVIFTFIFENQPFLALPLCSCLSHFTS
ncbi:hypothetical protein GOODEAATRI_001992 [Goodea atripinnis]|uniref:Uncharacterized protein n=1 Tax=Goodea atripinnis TaxID=208336 RepID=A0ABV0N9I6_9TELE